MLTITFYMLLFFPEVICVMDAKLLEQLRGATPALLEKWQAGFGGDPPGAQGFGRAMRELGTGLLPLLLDSLQFEGFAELDHFAARAGETAWTEGVQLGAVLASAFHLRSVLGEFISRKNRSAAASSGLSEIDREIDCFAAACAQAYVQSCARGAASQSQRQAGQLRAAIDALDCAVTIVDEGLRVRAYNAAFGELFELSAGAEGRSLGEVADEETATVMRKLIDEAASSADRAGGVLETRKGLARASAVGLTVEGEALFLIEVKAQTAGHADAASVLRQLLMAHGGGAVFGKLMKELRKESGISMRSLAERLGMARGYISNIESGKALPSFNAIVQICELLDPEGEEGLLVLGIVQRLPDEVRKKLLS